MSQVSQAESQTGTVEFPDHSLANARESRGRSVEQVAADLRLSVPQVLALEQGDYSKFPSIVFARGYIRSYARLVGLDGDALVRQFDSSHGGGQQSASIRSITRVRPGGSSGPGVSLSMLLLVVVIIAATFWWWKTQYGHEVALTDLPERTVAVETATGETLVLSAAEPVVLPQDSTAAGSSAGLVSDTPVAPSPVATVDAALPESTDAQSQLTGAVVNAPLASQVITLAPELDEQADAVPPAVDAASDVVAAAGLFVSFSDDCWVTIKDGNGKTLFNNIRKAGEELRIEQAGPLKILLGRTSAVSKITFAGSAIDLTPFNIKNVARLTLPLN